jgi:CMP-N,N'-diacetyllegionaminic acid synthase
LKFLALIPARGGSKGIPHKNIKPFFGKPLIGYSVELARKFLSDENICVSTDDQEIIKAVEALNLQVPFVRPPSLSGDDAGMYEVVLHALDFYKKKGKTYDGLILLQPTSPLRSEQSLREAINLYNADVEMVVSVKKTSANPYFKLYEEDPQGFLVKSKSGNFKTRQEAPDVWELNGAIYIYNVAALLRSSPAQFKKIKKYVMSEIESVDLDTPMDWAIAEFLKQKQIDESR